MPAVPRLAQIFSRLTSEQWQLVPLLWPFVPPLSRPKFGCSIAAGLADKGGKRPALEEELSWDG